MHTPNFSTLLIGITAGFATHLLAFQVAQVPHTTTAVITVTVTSILVGIAALVLIDD